jgi:hypothetical protein
MGVPAESRTVPETMIAGRGWTKGVCANAEDQFVADKMASAAKHTARGRSGEEGCIGGILLMTPGLARRVLDVTPGRFV